jgi:hypothetical protein
MSKITKVLSLLGKLDEASAKEAGKKVSKAKKEKIDSERVLEALNEKIADNPQYLDTLEDDEYFDLMEALPAKQRADVMGDDYGMEMIESQSEMMTSMKPKEAAENLSLFTGAEEVSSYLGQLDAKGLKEFKAAVSTEDADLYQTALDKLESLGPRAAKMKGGKMKNNPFKVKYNAGGSTKKQSSISASDHIANDWRMVDSNQLDSEEALDRSLSQLSKAKSSEELMDLKLQLAKSWEKVTDQELPEEFYNADFKNKKTLKKLDESVLKRMKERKNMGGKIKTKYAEGGSMLVPPEMSMPVDTYDNIPEDEQAAVESSQLPDNEMEEDYTEYVLEQSLDMEDQEYLMDVLEGDERLSSIFDKVMDVAGEFAGEGAVEGPGDGTSDSIPARLSDGEFVFTKKATDQLGADQLQTMMDDAERAYDGGYMKKAFGGMVDDNPTDDDRDGMYGETSEDEEIKKQMISSNRMPSVK